MANFKVKENIISKMVTYMKVNLNKTSSMVRGSTLNKMCNNIIRVSFKITRRMVMEFIIMRMVLCMRVSGKMISSMVKASIQIYKMIYMKVNIDNNII